ncbi:MAG: ERAP1-like C-terminal domain-containing protein [Alphaproteobacteria bacterium]|nr:ERAP1-like C-terminal domain-containing protein [Alphaproteobacteria bacterium]MBL6936326.1 ERAP1-like C-terminal domain-containing protein [Alphaproteobacteria bacterium]MBL7098623.1 ERAP1-like C-terminal domain-containing protein [Alphaproteobacteria bacterium]
MTGFRIRVALALALGAALALSGCSKPAPKTRPERHGPSIGGEEIPLGKLARVAVPERYRIALRIDPKAERFTGHVEIDVKFLKARRSLFLHGLNLNMSAVTVRVKGKPVEAAHYDQVHDSGVARLIFVEPVPAGEATLVFDYDAPFDPSLDGLYKVVDRGDSYAFTQFETTGARKVFPSFDEPGFKTPFQVTVIAPRGQKVISNTPILSATPSGVKGYTETTFVETYALPTYLVALAVGPLDIVDGGYAPPNRYRSKPLHIRGVTARGNGRRIGYALSLTPKIVAALENYFGIGFPFQKLDVLAVPDFGAGAMENAGAITFRERLLLLDQDASLEQKRASLTVQAHEIAHQWFGDLVSPAWWEDIWLNESFANWAEYKASAAVMPELNFDTDTVRNTMDVMEQDELPSARQIHQPINNLDDLANAFDSITYDKGGAVLKMFETYVGEENWQRGVHVYLTEHARGNAATADFIGTIAKTTGRPELVGAFNDFIDRPGVPAMKVTAACGTAPALNFAQSVYVPFGLPPVQRSWRVPVCLKDGAGRVCRMSDGGAVTVPVSAACTTMPLPNADGTGYYRFSLNEAEWKVAIADVAKLEPAEQVALTGNAFAALYDGQATAGDVVALVQALAPVARWDVLKSLQQRLLEFRQRLAPGDLPKYRAFIAKAFGPRLKTLELAPVRGRALTDTLAQVYLEKIMVTEARDPDTIKALASGGAVPSHEASLPTADRRAEALRASLLADPRYADTLLASYKTSDSESERRDIVYAFAGSDDPAVIKRLLALAPTMRRGELRYLNEYLRDEPVGAATYWNWMKSNFDMMAKRLSIRGMAGAAQILQNGCDAGIKSDVDAFFAPKLEAVSGARRRLAHTDEMIERCVAFRRAKGTEVSQALAAVK